MQNESLSIILLASAAEMPKQPTIPDFLRPAAKPAPFYDINLTDEDGRLVFFTGRELALVAPAHIIQYDGDRCNKCNLRVEVWGWGSYHSDTSYGATVVYRLDAVCKACWVYSGLNMYGTLKESPQVRHSAMSLPCTYSSSYSVCVPMILSLARTPTSPPVVLFIMVRVSLSCHPPILTFLPVPALERVPSDIPRILVVPEPGPAWREVVGMSAMDFAICGYRASVASKSSLCPIPEWRTAGKFFFRLPGGYVILTFNPDVSTPGASYANHPFGTPSSGELRRRANRALEKAKGRLDASRG